MLSQEQECMCVKNMEFEEVLVVISAVPCGAVAAQLPNFTAILVNTKRTPVSAALRQDCIMGSMLFNPESWSFMSVLMCLVLRVLGF